MFEFQDTFFAPAERASEAELARQKEHFFHENLYSKLLDATPDYLVVLNSMRQIIFANKAVRDLVNDNFDLALYGKRPGEFLDCINAFSVKHGCGTSKFCKTCGAVNAILSSLKGEESVQECRIVRKDTNDVLELRVWTKPLEIDGQKYSIFTFVDISNEKRREALEKIFFHDVLNTAANLKSYFSVLDDLSPEEANELRLAAIQTTNRLIEEISAQRDLSLAERKELHTNLRIVNSSEVLKFLVDQYINHKAAYGKKIKILPESDTVDFISDRILLTRVLSNMLKNALESTSAGGTVSIKCQADEDKIRFYVHNNGFIPSEVQLQIFQRSFTTKGSGRGLGTYSMKMLTEEYLSGTISFTSTESEGTTFVAEYPIVIEK